MKILNYYARDDGSMEFSIDSSNTLKEDFRRVVDDLKPYGMVAMLRKINEESFVVNVGAVQTGRSRLKSWMPVALFVVTVGVVLYDGLIRSQTMSARAYISEPWEMAAIYTLSLLGILGIHELGHMIAAKRHRVKATWPFFIPGVPGFFISPPTFGAVIFSRGHMVNRDVVFDVGVAGPIAGLIVTILVSTYGAMLSPLIPEYQASAMISETQLVPIKPSLLMAGSYLAAGKLVEGFVPVMSPVAFAAWIGFLVTFLNLLPAWQLDGGHITRAAVGQKWHRRLTYISVIILAALNYIIMALFILMMSSRSPDVKPLDDVSPLSKKRKIIYIVTLFLAFLCAPLPFSIV
jgi:membrane-associated protease RseP (regulator of RpoE activity)